MQNKKQLLLIHGALGTKKQFDELGNLLKVDYDIHTFDLPAHGTLAYQRGQFSMYEFANFVRNYIIQNKLYQPLVLGFSMGGYIALTLQSQSHIFSKIMTLGTKFHWDIATSEKEVKMLDPKKISEKVPHYANHLIALHSEEDWECLLEKHRDLMYEMERFSPLTDYSLRKINIPVFITRGENDIMTSKEESIEMAYKLSKGEFFEFAGAEHPIEKFDNLILSKKIREYFN